MKTLILMVIFLILCGCSSSRVLESGANPVNRSLLIDQHLGFGFEIPGIPLPIPKLNLDFGLHFRRLSPQEEIELELAKKGKYKGDAPIPIKLPEVGPRPIQSKLEVK